MYADQDSPPAVPNEAIDPLAAARRAHLRHVNDDSAGISRRPAANGFDYLDPSGRLIGDIETLSRIRKLAIPPAWTAIWICPDPNGHIQATGRDKRQRKQYRYHPRWREVRDASKFDKVLVFCRALPLIRARVDADLRRPGLPRERVLAGVIRLMEATLFRIGNNEYAHKNKSFGLTTLRRRHVAIEGGRLHLSFRGKGGKRCAADISDRRLARIIKRCADLPGYEIFQYVDAAGRRHAIDSSDVNAYLHDITGDEITAKDFRTWAATNLAALALQEFGNTETVRHGKQHMLRAVERVAAHLGNTPTICRRSYIHPEIFEGWLDGSLSAVLAARTGRTRAGMTPEEEAVAAFLRLRLEGRKSLPPSAPATTLRGKKSADLPQAGLN